MLWWMCSKTTFSLTPHLVASNVINSRIGKMCIRAGLQWGLYPWKMSLHVKRNTSHEFSWLIGRVLLQGLRRWLSSLHSRIPRKGMVPVSCLLMQAAFFLTFLHSSSYWATPVPVVALSTTPPSCTHIDILLNAGLPSRLLSLYSLPNNSHRIVSHRYPPSDTRHTVLKLPG